ncbi:MAG: DUF3596 domain-containing protein [Deltaproteobacteria bacterium]|nr:DUF3596 domain-containing protein [Deltaproteobacteria bacterium]
MGKVRVRTETGKLYLDFTYLGVRCREQTTLQDSIENRRNVSRLLKKIEAQITIDQFDYRSVFPGSKNIEKVEIECRRVAQGSTGLLNEIPVFSELAEQWFFQMEICWRQSHKRNIRRMLDQVLIPYFGKMCVAEVTRKNILFFRAELSKLQLRCGKLCSQKSLQKI